MVGRRTDQPARSGSVPAGQQAHADETPASDGPAGSMQASAGQQPAPDASNGPAAQAQPKRAAVPAGPFAQLLGPLHPVLRASPGAVLAAALLLHGAIAARDPSGPGSGHMLAWPLTVSFLRALMMPASIQRLSTAARAYAGVAVAVAAALQRRRQQQAQRQAQQQAQQQLPPPQQQQGPVPMQVERQAPPPYSRPPQPAQQPQPQPNGGLQGLVGAAKRKSSKPRSTQEALGVAGGSARHAGGGKDDAPKGSGRRRRKQPERLEVAINAGPSYAPTQGRVSKRNGSAQRRSPSLADILLPPEPLPRWGRQRPRLDSRCVGLALKGGRLCKAWGPRPIPWLPPDAIFAWAQSMAGSCICTTRCAEMLTAPSLLCRRASPQPTLASSGADANLDLEGERVPFLNAATGLGCASPHIHSA